MPFISFLLELYGNGDTKGVYGTYQDIPSKHDTTVAFMVGEQAGHLGHDTNVFT